MPSSDSFLRQLSMRETRKSTSKRWGGTSLNQKEGLNDMYNNKSSENVIFGTKKRVMVVVDQSSHTKHAMMWALTHVANKGDKLTILHIASSSSDNNDSFTSLADNLASICKACKPEVEVEALVILQGGPKMGIVISQVKKLQVSVLVLGQKKPPSFLDCICIKSNTEKFVEQCIDNLDCLTIGVRKQSKGVSGYLISTRWHKNFWLLA